MILHLALSALVTQVPTDYNGVWADRNGTFFVIYDSGLTSVFGDKLLWTADFDPVLKRWTRNGSPTLKRNDANGFDGAWTESNRASFVLDDGLAPEFSPLPQNDDEEHGEIHISSGRNNSEIVVDMRDGRENRTYRDSAAFLGKSSVMNLSGTYNDKELSVTLIESKGRSQRDISGTISVLGHTYNLQGKRRWEKAWFGYSDRDKGSPMGGGYIVWRPSKEFLNNRPLADEVSSDQILIFLRSVNSDFPKGSSRLLRR